MKVTTIIYLQLTAIEEMTETQEKTIRDLVEEFAKNLEKEAGVKLNVDDVRISSTKYFTHEGDDQNDSSR